MIYWFTVVITDGVVRNGLGLANGQNTAIIYGGTAKDLILDGAGNTATISGGTIDGICLDYIGANAYLMTQEYF